MFRRTLFVIIALLAVLTISSYSQTVLTVQINTVDCSGASNSGDYTVTNTTYNYYMSVAGLFSAYWVKVNGQQISNYTPDTIIPVNAHDIITIGIVQYPNPFGPPCSTGTGTATLYRQVKSTGDDGTD